jgi:hypothetical protein
MIDLHVTVTTVAHANSTIADHADHAQNAVTDHSVVVTTGVHANSTIADHADHAQNAVTAPHVTVTTEVHANSTIADHADHAQNAVTAHLAIAMRVLVADPLVVQVARVVEQALAEADHVNAALSVPLAAPRPVGALLPIPVGKK